LAEWLSSRRIVDERGRNVNLDQTSSFMEEQMCKYLCLLLCSFATCACNADAVVTQYLNLFDPASEELFVASTNAQLVTTSILKWWRPQNPLLESEVIYRIPLLNRAISSETYVSSAVDAYAEGDFVSFYASGDGQQWQLFNHGSSSTPLIDAPADTSFATVDYSQIYVKAVFRGDRPFVFQSAMPNSIAPYVRYAPVPEPSCATIAVAAILCFAANRGRKSG
jgi:hypothetical protein